MKKSAPASGNISGITPIGDRVLVRPQTAEEMGTITSFGIIIPETVKEEKSDRGIVIAVGQGKTGDDNKRIPMTVTEGDKVLYTKPWNDPIKIGGVEYYIVSESDILAIIN